jgi:hypothetical protein
VLWFAQIARVLLSFFDAVFSYEQSKMSDNKDSQNHHKPNEERTVSGDIEVRGAIQIFETNSAIDKHNAEREEDNAYKDSTRAYERTNLTFTRLTLIVSSLYFIATVFIFLQSKRSANAAKSAADTASHALTLSKDQFRIEERPYIWSYPIAGPNHGLSPLGEKIYIVIGFRNSGKTPATDVVATHSMIIAGPKDEALRKASEYIAEYPKITGAVLTPEIPAYAPTGYGPKLTKDVMADIQHGTWKVYVVGAIQYTDIFQPIIAPYETIYCVQYVPTGQPFGACDFRLDSFK